jgi:UDP-glucose 4-epimerase
MKILVSGGGGYIGSVLVEKLLNWPSHEVGLPYPITDGVVKVEDFNPYAVTQLTVVDNMSA